MSIGKYRYYIIATTILLITLILTASCRGNPPSVYHSSTIPTYNTVRLVMKSYGNHDELSFSNSLGMVLYDQRILSLKPEYVIDNPPHGLYGEMEEPKYIGDWLLQNIKEYQDAGIKVIGYISGGYEGSGGDDCYDRKWYSLEMNKILIKNMATIDKVDGVFIDECTDFPGYKSKAYLVELCTLAHSYGLLVWGNTGVDDFDEWYFIEGGFDFMQSSEAWKGQQLSLIQKKWVAKISVTGFSRSYTEQDAYHLTLDAWNKGIAFCYINDTEYVTIAPWFEEYVDMLRLASN
jgi:hypothetical protein